MKVDNFFSFVHLGTCIQMDKNLTAEGSPRPREGGGGNLGLHHGMLKTALQSAVVT
jgi:hypothetical protein